MRSNGILQGGTVRDSTAPAPCCTPAGLVDVQQAANRGAGVAAPLAGEARAARTADVAAYGAELDRLRAKFDPLFAATKRYETALEEIAFAKRIGAIDAATAARAHEATTKALNEAAQQSAGLTVSAGQTACALRQLGVQSMQAVSSIAAGQSVMMTMLQHASVARAEAASIVQGLGLTIGTACSLLVQGSVVGTGTQILVPGGVGPNNDFSNSSYFTIDNAGFGTWTALSGGSNFSPSGVTGTIGHANILVTSDDGSGSAFARIGTPRTATTAWSVPSTRDRATLGGAPWGTSTTMGTALGVGVYQRFAFYRSRLINIQVTALSSTGSAP